MRVPLLILCVLALFGGLVQMPLDSVFHEGREVVETSGYEWVEITTSGVPLIGLVVAYLFFLKRVFKPETILATSWGRSLQQFWFSGWGMDALYIFLFVRPIQWLADVNRDDIVDSLYNGIAAVSRLCYQGVAWTQTGRLRWYAAGMIIGGVVLIGLGET